MAFILKGEKKVLLLPVTQKENAFSLEKDTNLCILKYLSEDLDQQLRNKCVIVPDALLLMKDRFIEVEGESLILTNFVDVVGVID